MADGASLYAFISISIRTHFVFQAEIKITEAVPGRGSTRCKPCHSSSWESSWKISHTHTIRACSCWVLAASFEDGGGGVLKSWLFFCHCHLDTCEELHPQLSREPTIPAVMSKKGHSMSVLDTERSPQRRGAGARARKACAQLSATVLQRSFSIKPPLPCWFPGSHHSSPRPSLVHCGLRTPSGSGCPQPSTSYHSSVTVHSTRYWRIRAKLASLP